MSASLPVPLIAVAGTPAECGSAYGAAASDLIAANLDAYRRRFADEAGLGVPAIRRAGAAFRSATVAHLPRIAQMLDGAALGSGAPVEEIYALNARTELLYGTRRRSVARDGGCTAIGVLGSHTATGHLLLAQNWDWYPDQRDVMLMLRTRDETGHTVLTLTEAGMFAKAGLNSGGVGVCVNMLGCDRDGLGSGGDVGVPYHVLLRGVLEMDNLAWALRVACFVPRNASINLLLGQDGELIDLELAPGDVGWLHPVDGIITHANHFESQITVHDTLKELGGSSLFRSARARRLLADPAAARKVADDDLAAVLRDHASFPSSICRHLDEREAPDERSETVYSVQLDLDDRRVGLASGPPCGSEYAWIDLWGERDSRDKPVSPTTAPATWTSARSRSRRRSAVPPSAPQPAPAPAPRPG
jgi:isopenicillin-N N-acyltransferase like protein